ncbi:excinuclease ABC subunit UvrA [Finegoldia magna]|uniref:excinuclease ABC subunit UvrA n=2 Tax=Finegoldia magna TaxID=1260 RepID=UPI0007642FC9|nr:excinuclease ABC subunit UvrA [Finegoldia magna]KXA09211.1 excinuclease ABC, A subunit [Finegoldia magna]MDU1214182.1 excinuclease ABC subunit UvrA [Finegoldia magna]MDU5273117.1 excinuclease ABC subunit UvrA [Finegoldia magna]
MSKDKIIIKGAKENNLKNVDLTIPRNKMVVFTGLSGSGKSSLAFDTIYAEGQRRYVESLSSYARQFLGQMDKPDVEYIEGLSPSISIDQKTTNNNPRSTVGTVTEIYDYFRLLFARVGTAYCPVCGKQIVSQTVDQIVDSVKELEERSRIQILSPVVKGKKGEFKKLLQNLRKDGFIRAIVDGEQIELAEDIELDKNKKHDIDVIVDRIIIKDGIDSRLTDSIETALRLSENNVKVDVIGKEVISYSTSMSCPDGHISYEELEPRDFSFNNPFGMCPHCNGLGFHKKVDEDLVIPNMELSISQGAIDPYQSSKPGGYYYEIIKAIADSYDFPLDKPIKEAPKKMINEILHGSKKNLSFIFDSHFSGRKKFNGKFEGVLKNLEERYNRSTTDSMHQKIGEYMTDVECDYCHGARLKDEYLSVRINEKNIYEICQMPVKDSLQWFKDLELEESKKFIGDEILKEIISRLQFLNDVGLDYLTLDRSASTLSGGESQRIRLATQIGSALVGVVYVLDEPSIGLHQRDNDKLIKALRNLTDIGNTLVVVEHDEDTMKECDYLVDIGPGAGVHGGEVVACGTIDDIIKEKRSITGKYLSGELAIPVPEQRRKSNGYLEFKGCKENNLKNINAKFALSCFNCVTGVSGSGKSSLVNEIVYKKLARDLNNAKMKNGKFKSATGIENLDKVVQIDQSPIGRTPRSNPATYTKVFDLIRDLFASTPEANMRGYQKGRFSFNVKGGRCEACKGDGTIKVEMHFLPDVYVPCDVCKGKRYNRETLQVKYKGKNIADVLDMTIDEALEFFRNFPPIKNKLQTLQDVGLGYIKLGQSSTELSGGEAQRVKLASELSKKSTGKTVYILDEPTTGLHSADIDKLIEVLQRLVDQGNTVIVIEHNLDVIKVADYIIDLGPEGGNGGGEVMFQGTPEKLINKKNSYTGQYLAPKLNR